MILRPDVDFDFVKALAAEHDLDGDLCVLPDGAFRLVCRAMDVRAYTERLWTLGFACACAFPTLAVGVIWFTVDEVAL